jgi:hypothetical protein
VYILFAPYSPPIFPVASPLQLVPATPPSGRTCSILLFSDFVEKNKKDKKENKAFLLV